MRATLDLGITETDLTVKQMRRVRAISGATFAMIWVALFTVVQSWAVGKWDVIAYLGIATSVGLGNLALLRKTHDPQLSGHVAVATLAALISLSAMSSGGFYNPSFAWLYIIPLAAAVALDVRGAAVWVGITVAISAVFWVLPEIGIRLPDKTPPELASVNALMARILTISALGAIGVGFVVAQRRSDTELERETTYLELLMHAAVSANEATSFEDALGDAVDRICSSMGWVAGHVLEVNDEGTSRSTGRAFFGEAPRRIPEGSALERLTRERVFAIGDGLPGRAVFFQRPQIETRAGWVGSEDRRSESDRGAAARALGLQAAMAVPVLVHGRVRAVLELGSAEPLVDPERILEVFTHISKQLGRVAERSELQDRLRQTQKMEAVGQLAAGLAHEINNPMAFVRSNLHSLREMSLPERDEKPEREEFQDLIEESLEGVERTIAIVRDVMHFSRIGGAGPAQFEAADVNDLLRDALRVARSDVPEEVRFELDTAELAPLRCSANGLRQVFLNLIVNAVQAVSGRGTIRLVTRSAEGEVVVRVEDDGPGMTARERERLFDPFFTTKPVGEGTGLGLTVSYEIAKTHGGTIRVESEPGAGAAFEVRLPRSLHEGEPG